MARRTGFGEQYYTGTRDISVSGKIAGTIKVKLYVGFGWLFDHISGLTSSFGLSYFVNLDMVSLTRCAGLGPRGAQVAPLRVHCASVLCIVRKVFLYN